MIDHLRKRHDELVKLLLGWLSTQHRTKLRAELREIRVALGLDGELPRTKRVPQESRHLCFDCAGLPWRRDKEEGCPGCGGRYQAEPAVTLDYIFALPRAVPKEVA